MVIVGRDAITDRYRLDVMATRTVDVVRREGGWLFDRAMAGWDVTVLLAEHDDVRPLQILDVRAIDLELALGGPERRPAALSVATNLYAAEERVRHAVAKTLKCGTVEITMWREHQPLALTRRFVEVHHELSSAAGIYKAHALAAAGLSVDSIDPIESFGRARRDSPSFTGRLLRATTS